MLVNIDWLKLTVWLSMFAFGIASWVGVGRGLALLWEAL